MNKIYSYDGKDYIRMGECNQCGECCLGWPNPCPMLEFCKGKASCKIYDSRSEENNEEVLKVSGVHTKQCAEFPDVGDWMNSVVLRNKCGYYFVECPKVLVACPTYFGKEYAFQEWIDNVKNLSYPNYDVLVVDNSPDDSYVKKWGDKIPMEHIETNENDLWTLKICKSMQRIKERFLEGGYEYWMNIEADNIPPKDVIENMIKFKADWVSHCYPVRPDSETLEQGIGCSLLSKNLVQGFDWSKASDSPDAELWDFAKPIRSNSKYKTIELWGVFNCLHLK